jgi:hypothetical protein
MLFEVNEEGSVPLSLDTTVVLPPRTKSVEKERVILYVCLTKISEGVIGGLRKSPR